MTQDSLYEKLYGTPKPNPEEERKVEPHLKARSGRAFLESLKDEQHLGSPCQPESDSEPD